MPKHIKPLDVWCSTENPHDRAVYKRLRERERARQPAEEAGLLRAVALFEGKPIPPPFPWIRLAACVVLGVGAGLGAGLAVGRFMNTPSLASPIRPASPEVLAAKVESRPGQVLGANDPAKDYHLNVGGLDRRCFLTVVILEPNRSPLVFPGPTEDPFVIEAGEFEEYGPLRIPEQPSRNLVILTERPIAGLIRALLEFRDAKSEESVRQAVRDAVAVAGLNWLAEETVEINPADERFKGTDRR